MLKLEKLQKALGDKFDAFKKTFMEDEIPAEVKFIALADGSGNIKGDLTVGSAITMSDSSGADMPCPDGEYALANGKTVKCMDGKVVEVADTKAEATEEVMSAEKIQEAIQTALSAQAEVFNKQIETLTKELADSKEANKAKFTAMAEAMELVASMKEEKPERKNDPTQKFTEQKQKNFNSLLSVITQIKENK